MIDSETGWNDALRELTRLPPGPSEGEGEVNFLRAIRYRRNARALFDLRIRPLLAGGASFEVVVGFVDRDIAAGLPFLEGIGYVPEMAEFMAARLRNSATGEIVDVRLPAP